VADPSLSFASGLDDDWVIAGNGGVLARETLAQLPDVDTVVTPVGGGGLAAGLGWRWSRGIHVLGVSPEPTGAMKRSLEDGRAYTQYDGGPTWPRAWRVRSASAPLLWPRTTFLRLLW